MVKWHSPECLTVCKRKKKKKRLMGQYDFRVGHRDTQAGFFNFEIMRCRKDQVSRNPI